MDNKAKSNITRVAIYCRVSTSNQAMGDYSSIVHQREAAEAFVLSRKHEGWIALSDHYDDPGYSGANLDRPALQKLIRDIEDDKIDCILSCKLDRLTRSIYDFPKLNEIFEHHNVSFATVTEPINTADATGRLFVNILLSFGQHQRECTAERTRAKVVSARKRGRWTGGPIPLGYDLLPEGGGLAVNKDEAERVRAIFELYLKLESLTEVLTELRKRRWKTKSWRKINGDLREGIFFQKGPLRRLLSNVIFIGRVKCKGETYNGAHEPIVDRELWDRVQRLLNDNRRNFGKRVRNKNNALLVGLLWCSNCNAPMNHTFTTKRSVCYAYYVCSEARRSGWETCPTKSVPVSELDQIIIERIRAIGSDKKLIRATVKAAQSQLANETQLLMADIKAAERDLSRLLSEEKKLLSILCRGGVVATRATERIEALSSQITDGRQHLSAIKSQEAALRAQEIDQKDLTKALCSFDAIWAALLPRERRRIVQLLVCRVDFNAETGTLGITFHPAGIKTLVVESTTDSEG